jgi:enterochelin esterase-like enzyme
MRRRSFFRVVDPSAPHGQPSVPAWEVSDPAFETDGIRQLTVSSAALGGRGDVSMWVPERAALDHAPVILVLLHGVYGSHWAWFGRAGAHLTARCLIAGESIRPVVLACPSDGLWRDGSGYLDHAGGAFETWIVRDALVAVREVLGPELGSGPAAIAGLSMGGYGALRLGARHPDVFLGAVGHSSITRFADLAAFTRDMPRPGPVPSDALDLAGVLLAARDRLPAIRLDCGIEDPLVSSSRELHAALVAGGVAHEYAEHPGGHDWAYWAAHLEDTLRFVDLLTSTPRTTEPEHIRPS